MVAHDDAVRLVLELRIHGVNNTSPEAMLDRPKLQVEQVDGDDLGGFWRVRTALMAERGPGDRGNVPRGVQREAYSWGGLARSSPGASGTSVTAKIVNGILRVVWLLVLPFGLANLAYWSRALPNNDSDADRKSWRWGGRGARGLRLFALGLTVLLISTVCELALDLFANQCSVPRSPCVAVPRPLMWLGAADLSGRMANASAIPLLVLAGLWLFTVRSRLRYEEVTPASPPDTSGRMLGRVGLWQGGQMVKGLTQLHVAAGAAVIAIASAWPAVFSTGGSACTEIDSLTSGACWAQVGNVDRIGWFAGTLIAAVLALSASVVLVIARIDDGPDVRSLATEDEARRRRWDRLRTSSTWGALGLALVTLVVQNVALRRIHPPIAPVGDGGVALLGVNSVPTVVVAVLVGIAASALAWRSKRRVVPGAMGLFVAVGLVAAHWKPWVGAGIVLVALGVLGWSARQVGEPVRRNVAWGGTGPGVFLALSLAVAMTLSTLVVVGVGDWLNGPTSAAGLLSCDTATTSPVCIPPVYRWFGTSLAVALLLLAGGVIVVLVLWGIGRRGGRYPDKPEPEPEPEPVPAVRAARNAAALAHRAERFTAIVAALSLLSVLVAVGGAATRTAFWADGGTLVGLGAWFADWAAIAAGLTAALIVGLVGGAGSLIGHRPLGLIWDLLCFLPRAAHPFSAPCYAERAVPEIVGRVRRWLSKPGRTAVLSAHSLGAVLAVAALFMLDKRSRQRISLFTYGVQLRAYFGRILPDLLGPDVLGTPPCRAAVLCGVDPWSKEVESSPADLTPFRSPPKDTVRELVGDRWINLWRRTDYLGFPVFGYQDRGREPVNDIDRRAAEIDTTNPGAQPDTHSDYPRTPEYSAALDRLSRRRG